MTSGAGEEQVDLYDPAYIYRSIFGSKMKGHRQTWPLIDLSELQSINPDCVGWIHIDGCPVNYPVVKQHFDRSYYLTHNFSGEESVHGQVCLDFHEPFNTFAAFAVIEGESLHKASAGAITNLSSD